MSMHVDPCWSVLSNVRGRSQKGWGGGGNVGRDQFPSFIAWAIHCSYSNTRCTSDSSDVVPSLWTKTWEASFLEEHEAVRSQDQSQKVRLKWVSERCATSCFFQLPVAHSSWVAGSTRWLMIDWTEPSNAKSCQIMPKHAKSNVGVLSSNGILRKNIPSSCFGCCWVNIFHGMYYQGVAMTHHFTPYGGFVDGSDGGAK